MGPVTRTAALEMADAAIAMGEETTFFWALLAARIVKGWAVQATNLSYGVDQLREAVKVLSESRAGLCSPSLWPPLPKPTVERRESKRV